ncbi:MAG: GNAT family N-acetyltransferase [Caldilineaceae bacterium]
MSILIRPAQIKDAPQIVTMVNRFAAQNIMLPRSEENVCQTIHDWVVAIETPDIELNSFITKDTPADAIFFTSSSATNWHHASNKTDRHNPMDENAIAKEYSQIIGCGALVPLNDTLVEVRSLAIHESQQGNGLGSVLVLHLTEMAREHDYTQICALTLRPNFFIRLGFTQVDRWSISSKVWQACIYCPKFHRCDEFAVLMDLASHARRQRRS